jgi:methionyl-tRNA formyltransferase
VGLVALRLAFLGTPDFAVPTLAELMAQGHDIAAVYSQPPRPRGRGLALEKGAVHKFAETAGLEVRTPPSLKGADEQAAFATLKLDAAVVVAYGLLLPKAILEAPRMGCFNLHGSLLPRWRGAAPIQRAVMAGDAETGVMVMQMDEGLDTGPVLMAERVAVGRQTSGELTERLARLGADLMVRALGALERGAIEAMPQATEGVTYAKKIEKSEARIFWSGSADEIDCQIRALSPLPGAWTEASKNGPERIKIFLAEPVSGSGVPGHVLEAGERLIVACGTGALRILKMQKSGSTVQDAVTFQRGYPMMRGFGFL